MNQLSAMIIAFSLTVAPPTHLLAVAGGVSESTDATKAAAIERMAKELKARAPTSIPKQSPDGLVHGKSQAGIGYVCGGIGIGQLKAMSAQRAGYSLWVVTVAKGSGAYLSDARLRVSDVATKQIVVDLTMYGPWLFAALPPGRYEISATVPAEGAESSQTLTTRVAVTRGEQRQAVFRFASTADVDPAQGDSFNGNPFGGQAPQR